MFEEAVEHTWDKGDNSGIVMYTDAMHWDNQRGDFDERHVDDWGIDATGATERDTYGILLLLHVLARLCIIMRRVWETVLLWLCEVKMQVLYLFRLQIR